jgi:hypothetical protein
MKSKILSLRISKNPQNIIIIIRRRRINILMTANAKKNDSKNIPANKTIQ